MAVPMFNHPTIPSIKFDQGKSNPKMFMFVQGAIKVSMVLLCATRECKASLNDHKLLQYYEASTTPEYQSKNWCPTMQKPEK